MPPTLSAPPPLRLQPEFLSSISGRVASGLCERRQTAVVMVALVPTTCTTRRNAMAATPSSKAELLGSEQRAEAAVKLHVLDLDFAEFGGDGAGEGGGAEERDDAADGGAAGHTPAPLLHRAARSPRAGSLRPCAPNPTSNSALGCLPLCPWKHERGQPFASSASASTYKLPNFHEQVTARRRLGTRSGALNQPGLVGCGRCWKWKERERGRDRGGKTRTLLNNHMGESLCRIV